MDCERCLEQLDAYLDSELDARSADWLAEHLRQCPTCRAEYQAREWEARLYRDLAAEVSLPEGLWTCVANGIATVEAREQRRSGGVRAGWFWPERLGWWRLGWALGGVGLLTVGMWLWLRTAPTPEPLLAQGPSPSGLSDTLSDADVLRASPPVSPPMSASDTSTPSDAAVIEPPRLRTKRTTSPQPLREHLLSADAQMLHPAEQAYLVVIERLQAQVRPRRMKLDPATRMAMDETLAGLDTQIAQTREAVRQAPTDPATLHFLMAAYRRKAEVLSEIIVMTEN